MYNKMKNKPNYFDRDSGIVTESESDFDLLNNKPNYIFSDDDDDQQQRNIHNLGDIYNIPTASATGTTTTTTTTQNYKSPNYYANMADQSVISIRHYLTSLDWKKVLKHKSGTTVYMLQNTQEKTALFRGEAIIQGFTPQSIFYVIGMRKLWDEG